MKKTYVTLLSLLGILATGSTQAAEAQRLITFGNQATGSSVQTDFYADTINNGQEGSWKGMNSGTQFTGDDLTITAEILSATSGEPTTSEGKLWRTDTIDLSGKSGAAWDEYETFTGVNPSTLNGGGLGAGTGETGVRLTISDPTLTSDTGKSLIMYLVVGSVNGDNSLTLNVSGLENISITSASGNGGWNTSGSSLDLSQTIGAREGVLVKVEGTLTGEDLTVDIKTNKSFVTGIAYATIPEPTTATLSLLALAGLCARRRRK